MNLQPVNTDKLQLRVICVGCELHHWTLARHAYADLDGKPGDFYCVKAKAELNSKESP